MNDNKTLNKLKAKLSILEKEKELFYAIITESDRAVTEKLNDLENLILDLQSEDSKHTDEFKEVYDFIREIQKLQNQINEKELMLSASLKKVEELTLRYSEVDRLKNEFLENTSHEIRTPLNAVLGYLELLKNGLYSSPEEMMEFINGGVQSANQLLKLLNDIIDVTQTESRVIEIDFEDIDIKKLTRTVYDITKIQAEQKGINYSLNLPDGEIFVRANTDRVKQIFLNLISNALKFTSTKGNITINIRSLPHQNYVLCEVIDDGIGIAKENITLIFDKFTQIESNATRNYQGAGLGLSITKSLIELMGGLINVKSQIGKGSNFSFTIPLASTESMCDLNVPFNKNSLKIVGDKNKPLIAIISNDINLRDSIKDALLYNDYSVITGNTADDGLLILKEMNPSLIMLDWALPRRKSYDLINGIELYKLIKANVFFSRIPVLITTGHPVEYVQLFNPKISPRKVNYFKKPFDINALIKRVDYHFKINTQQKNLILVMDSDVTIFKQILKNIPTRYYSVKNFDNYRNVLPFIIYNNCKKAIFIFNPISASVIEHDINHFVEGGLNDIDFSAIVIANHKKHSASKSLFSFTKGKVATMTKDELFKNPNKIFDLIKKVK
jgi:signal transduction histidine kinase/CheY-like chemotaxis protein